MSAHILIVEDQSEVAGVLQKCLEREGFRCEHAADGEEALARVGRHQPDLVLLDRVLPRLSGDDVVRRLKADPRTRTIPVIMLTAKSDETDEVVGFALGADDYLPKPFSPRVLLARVQARLRSREMLDSLHAAAPVSSVLLDRERPRVFIDKTAVALTPTEYRILATLMAARGHVLRSELLVTLVFGSNSPDEQERLAGQVSGLQRKMGPAAACIQVVASNEYAFCAPPGAASEHN